MPLYRVKVEYTAFDQRFIGADSKEDAADLIMDDLEADIYNGGLLNVNIQDIELISEEVEDPDDRLMLIDDSISDYYDDEAMFDADWDNLDDDENDDD